MHKCNTVASVTQRTAQPLDILRDVVERYSPAALASSFSVEDMVLLDLIDRHGLGIEVFSLDTGRLPEETYQLLQEVRGRYRTPILTYTPSTESLEDCLAAHGPNAFYKSVALRQACCRIRKVQPLGRALAGKAAWITGQRRQQSATRRDLAVHEWDADNRLHKLNPLADWSNDDVWTYVRERDVPYNALYDRGYASIGCAPCTRAITAGEDVRAGRWWWEDAETKECGLHAKKPSTEERRISA
jgi:phosphoadenosine phosphosulfate reductase